MRPQVIAHRGASGHAWQNSATAFHQAVELGAEAVELDIHATRDGVLLVHHDADVAGIGRIAELPVSAFSGFRLPDGGPIPTLAEALELCAGLDVWVEVKTLPPSGDRELFATLDSGPNPRGYAVHSFDHRIIDRLGDARPELRRGVLLASYLLDTLPILRAVGADTLWMDTQLIDAELVRLLHDDGAQLIAWTANEPREISRLLELGVDGICGNYPDRVLQLRG